MLKQVLSRLAIFLLFTSLALAQAGQFVEAPQFATGGNPQAVAWADFNNDGIPDLVVANSSSNTISILLGNGDGTFKPKADFSTGTTPEGVAVGDFNGDGNSDIAVTDSGNNVVSILLGNGDGTFQPRKNFATGKGPWGVAVGDFNKDGNADLVVTNATAGTISILLGNGDGTFQAHVDYNSGFDPVSVVVADLDKNGNQDVAVACNVNTTHNGANVGVISVLLGHGDGTFNNQLQFYPAPNPVSIVAADFNNDGFLDLAVAGQGNTVSVLLSNGNAGSWNMLAPVNYATAAFPTGVAAGKFNGDNNIDLAVSAGNGNTVSVLLGNGDGTFQPQIGYGAGDIPYGVIAADFNGDSRTDLVVANSGGNSVSVILGNGDGTFQTRIDYPAGPSPYAVATGYFTGNGVLDLAVANSNCPSFPTCGPGTVSIELGNGDGSFQPPVPYSTGTNTDPRAIAVGKFVTNSNVSDLAVANYATGTVSVFLGNGDGTFADHVDYKVESEPDSIAVGDFNGDKIPDLVVANYNSNTVSVLLGNGDGTFQSAVSYAVGHGPISVAVADFNGDNKLDLVVVNETDNDVSILLGNGDGTFSILGASPNVGGNPKGVVVGDFNHDGIADLAVADYQTQQVSVLLGNGDGTFQPVKAYSTGANPWSIVAADFNGDGITDLALTSTPLGSSPGNLVSLLLGKGDGTFGAYSLFSAGYQAYSSVVGDFNGDTAPDLAVVNGNSNTVSILVNAQGTKMTLSSSGSPSISGQSVTFTVTVKASVAESGTPTGTVKLQNGNTVLGSGTLSADQVMITTSALPVGTDTVSAVYLGDSNFQAHTVSITQQVNAAPDFQISASALSPSTVTPPGSATSTITLTPLNGMNVTEVTLTCSVAPSPSHPATCAIGTMSVSGGTGTATLTINTVGPTAALSQPVGLHRQSGGLLALGLIIPAMLLGTAGLGKQNRKKMLGVCLVFLVLSGCAFQVACGGGSSSNNNNGGGGGNPGTPSGQYTITITGTAGGGLQHAATPLTLTVQ